MEREFGVRGEVHPHVGRSLEEVYDYYISFRYILELERSSLDIVSSRDILKDYLVLTHSL